MDNASIEAVSDYLFDIATDRMGLPPTDKCSRRCDAAAAALVALRERGVI